MRIFVTGAGHIGAAVVVELRRTGHKVVCLGHSDRPGAALDGTGAQVEPGALDSREVLHRAAAMADGVIHLAYMHDAPAGVDPGAADQIAIEALADGTNRRPAVHSLEAARLFRLTLEQAPAGSRWHGVGDDAVPIRNLAQVIGPHLGIPTVSVEPDEAESHFGSLSFAVATDNPAFSAWTCTPLGWQPEHPGLIADLDHGNDFAG